MSEISAWIMKANEKLFVSVSQMELVHIINEPSYMLIPGTPAYCCNVVIWNDNILPVINLFCLIDSSYSVNPKQGVVAVIIYRDNNQNINYGGINLIDTPILEPVKNKQVCLLPDTYTKLQNISLSCFKNKDGNKVPILDTSKLFSREFSTQFLKDRT